MFVFLRPVARHEALSGVWTREMTHLHRIWFPCIAPQAKIFRKPQSSSTRLASGAAYRICGKKWVVHSDPFAPGDA